MDPAALPDVGQLNRVLYAMEEKKLIVSGEPKVGTKSRKPTWTVMCKEEKEERKIAQPSLNAIMTDDELEPALYRSIKVELTLCHRRRTRFSLLPYPPTAL